MMLFNQGEPDAGSLSHCAHGPRDGRDQPRRGRLEGGPGVQEGPGQDVPGQGRGLRLHGDGHGLQEAAAHGDRVRARA